MGHQRRVVRQVGGRLDLGVLLDVEAQDDLGRRRVRWRGGGTRGWRGGGGGRHGSDGHGAGQNWK